MEGPKWDLQHQGKLLFVLKGVRVSPVDSLSLLIIKRSWIFIICLLHAPLHTCCTADHHACTTISLLAHLLTLHTRCAHLIQQLFSTFSHYPNPQSSAARHTSKHPRRE